MGACLATACCTPCVAGDQSKTKYVGMKKNRSCTDVICCFVYFISVVGFFGLALLSYLYGDLTGPKRDSNGFPCNEGENFGKPLLYVQNPDGIFTQLFLQERSHTRQSICVEKCPDFNYSPLEDGKPTKEIEAKYKLLCRKPELFKPDDAGISYVNAGCMPFALQTKDLNGLCIPDLRPLFDAADDSINKTSALFGKNMSASVFIDESIADLQHTWQYIVGFLAGAALFSLIITLCMRWFSGFAIWFSISAFLSGTLILIGFSGYKFNDLNGKPGTDLPLTDVPYQYWASNVNFWKWLIIVGAIVFFIMLLITIGLRKRIKGAISVMKIASSALASSPMTAVFPLFPFILSCLVLGVFIVAFFSLHTMPLELDNPSMQWLSDNVVAFKLTLLFCCVWHICFLTGLQKVTLAGTYAEYYWNGSSSLTSGFYRSVRYHLGSIGFGAFIMASFRFILILLALLIKSKRLTSKLKKVAKCLACCIGCIERMMNYITDRAYIIIGVKGTNYLRSAQIAMGLIVRNPLHATVLDNSSTFIIWLCRLIVVGSSIGLSYGVFYEWDEELTNKLNNPFVPIIIIAIGAYIVSQPFFLVHRMAITTTFMCFMEDSEENDGTQEKPYANRQTQKHFGRELQKLNRKSGRKDELREMS